MSFLVAVRPASAFSLKKPFFSSRVRARASLVVSLGNSDLDLVQLGSGGGSLRGCSAGSSGACGGGRAAAGGQGSGSSGHAGNFQKITTSDLRHFVFPLYFYKNVFVRCGTIRILLHRKQKKKTLPSSAGIHPQGRKRKTSVVPPWFTVPSQRQPHCCGVLQRDNRTL